MLSDGLVSIRDAAYSRFDRAVVVSEYTPTGGLKVSHFIGNSEIRSYSLFLFLWFVVHI